MFKIRLFSCLIHKSKIPNFSSSVLFSKEASFCMVITPIFSSKTPSRKSLNKISFPDFVNNALNK